MLTQKTRQGRFLALFIGAVLLSGNQAVAGPRLEELLMRTGRSVELFWQQVASYTCIEIVTQEKIDKKKTEYKVDSTYDYLAITKADEEGLTIEELRLPKGKSSHGSHKTSLLSTNGFPTLLLIFIRDIKQTTIIKQSLRMLRTESCWLCILNRSLECNPLARWCSRNEYTPSHCGVRLGSIQKLEQFKK
jgi:hypothetical protein